MRAITRREQLYGLIFLSSLAFGAWNYRHLFTSGSTTTASGPSVSAPTAASRIPGETPAASDTPANQAEEAWGTDPFNRDWRGTRTAPAQPGAVVRKGALKLSAIVVRPPKRFAIINGLIVREGDSVAGRRVTRIESSHVLLDDQGVEVTLTL